MVKIWCGSQSEKKIARFLWNNNLWSVPFRSIPLVVPYNGFDIQSKKTKDQRAFLGTIPHILLQGVKFFSLKTFDAICLLLENNAMHLLLAKYNALYATKTYF